MTNKTKNKLKTITLVMTPLPDYQYEYKAIDDNGKVIATRFAQRAGNGKTYIAVLVTKNRNYKWPYSIQNMFTFIRRIDVKKIDKRRIPYAIAVVEEYKAEYAAYDYDNKQILKSEVDR